jgi:C4-dicarboxylate-specific signal transduction histidine kinase
VQQALKGVVNAYAAVGHSGPERWLYMSAPIHEGTDSDSPVIGSVLFRLPFQKAADALAMSGQDAVLLTPDGVAFAATRAEWGRAGRRPEPAAHRGLAGAPAVRPAVRQRRGLAPALRAAAARSGV